MDRRSLVRGAGVAGAAAVAGLLAACGKKEEAAAPAAAAPAAPAVQTGGPSVRWRLASSFPKSLDTIFGTAEVFAKKVSEITSGKFQISVHAGGELMPAFGVVDGVQNASVEMAHTAPYYYYGKDPTFCLGCAVPFGLNSRQMSAWMYEGNGLTLMREFYAAYNIINLPGGNTGAQMGGWFRKEIKTVADLKGLKFRTNPFAGKVLEPFGVVPQSIPGADLYPALEKGTLDALEWVGPYDDQKLGFNKVAPFYYYPGWWEGGPQLDFYINNKAWEALPPEYKAAVEAAASHAHVTMQAKYDVKNPTALKEMVGTGTKLRPFSNEILTAAFKSAQQIYADLNNSNPAWKKVYGDYSKFLADQNAWFRFSEGLFDRFMQSQKL